MQPEPSEANGHPVSLICHQSVILSSLFAKPNPNAQVMDAIHNNKFWPEPNRPKDANWEIVATIPDSYGGNIRIYQVISAGGGFRVSASAAMRDLALIYPKFCGQYGIGATSKYSGRFLESFLWMPDVAAPAQG